VSRPRRLPIEESTAKPAFATVFGLLFEGNQDQDRHNTTAAETGQLEKERFMASTKAKSKRKNYDMTLF
jgi:hypothetical protein